MPFAWANVEQQRPASASASDAQSKFTFPASRIGYGRALFTPNGGSGGKHEVVPDRFGGMMPQKCTPPPRSNGMQQTPVNINLDG